MTSARTVPVSLAEIARIAGVGRAAVSNWRRRYATFPERIAGTDTSPQFSLADVERWLRANGKLKEAGSRELLWPRFEALGSRDGAGLAIAEAGRRMRRERARAAAAATATAAGGAEPLLEPLPSQVSPQVRELVAEAVRLGRREGAEETFGFLLRRWLDTHVRQISTTPPPLAALMAEIALRTATVGALSGGPLTVLDPACGTGHLLTAAAAAATSAGSDAEGRDGGGRDGGLTGARTDAGADASAGTRPALRLIGCDKDPTAVALAATRLAFATDGTPATAAIRQGDSLRADPHPDLAADIVLCNPPYNERDWGYEELATDPRWAYGLPPRTEPELAWVQYALARLRPGGAAVLLLPPAVAARKAGRRIRGALLRAGVLRAVVALPPGCAQPHSVSLHLWVLRAPGGAGAGVAADSGDVLLVDAARQRAAGGGRESGPGWEALSTLVRAALDLPEEPASTGTAGASGVAGAPGPADPSGAGLPAGSPADAVRMAPIDLLDDEVDLTPGRYVARTSAATGRPPAESWREFTTALTRLGRSRRALSRLCSGDGEPGGPPGSGHPTTSVGELARAGALTLRSGQQPPGGTVVDGEPAGDGVPLLTVPDLHLDPHLHGPRPGSWLHPADAASATVAEAGDVVVAGVFRAFSAWVHEGPATALGPQLYALRADPARLDAHFLAGCLRAPSNSRQAGTHTSSSSRVDVRRLLVLQLPLADQRRYGETFRQITAFEDLLTRAGALGTALARDLGDRLATGRLTPEG